MKDATFQYGNIFEEVRKTAHATVRMVFQFQCPELANVNNDSMEDYPLFGISPIMKQWQMKVDLVFEQLINQKPIFSNEHIDEAIKKNIDSTMFVDPPNVVILKPGKAPSKNEHVHNAVDMFLEDFSYTEDGILRVEGTILKLHINLIVNCFYI